MTAGATHGENAGLSPLAVAVKSGSHSSVRALVQQGALTASSSSNNLAGDSSGFTPLHYAAERGDLYIIKLLLSHGASISTTDRLGRVPEAIAQRNNHHSAVKLFREFRIDDVIKSSTTQPHSSTSRLIDQRGPTKEKKPRRVRAAESVENILGLGLGRKSSVTRSLDEARQRSKLEKLVSRSGSTSSGSASLHGHQQESSGSTNGSAIPEHAGYVGQDGGEYGAEGRTSRAGSASSSNYGRRRPSTAPSEKTTFDATELAARPRSIRGSISRPSSRASVSSGSPMMNLPFSSFNGNSTNSTSNGESQFYRPRKSSLLSSGFSSPLPPTNSSSPSVPPSPDDSATPVFDDRDDEVDDVISFLNNSDIKRSSSRPSAFQSSRRDSSATTHSSMDSSGTESALDKSRRPSEESLQYMKNRSRSIGEEFGASAGTSEDGERRDREENVTIKARSGATTTMSNSSSGRSSFSIPIPNRSDALATNSNSTNEMRSSRSNSLSTQSSTSQSTGTTEPTEYSLSSDPNIPQSSPYPTQSQQPSANPNRSLSTLSPLYEMNHFAFLNPNSATAKPLTTAEARMKVKSVEKDLLNFNLNLPKSASNGRRGSEAIDPSSTLKARSRGVLDVRRAGEMGNVREKKSSLSEQLANYGRALALERNLKEQEERGGGGVVFEVIKSAAGLETEVKGKASEKLSAVSTNGKIYGQPQWSLAPSRSPLIPAAQSTAAPPEPTSPPDSPNRPNMKTKSTSQQIKSIRRPSLVGGVNSDPSAVRRGSATAEGERGVVYEVVNPKSLASSSRVDDLDTGGARRSDASKAKGTTKKGPGRRSAGSSTDSSSKTTTSPAALDTFGVAAPNGTNGGASGSNGASNGGKLKGLRRFLGIKRR